MVRADVERQSALARPRANFPKCRVAVTERRSQARMDRLTGRPMEPQELGL